MSGFGLSVVDDTPQEIMYVSIEKVQVDKTTSATETKIEVRRCKCTFCQPQSGPITLNVTLVMHARCSSLSVAFKSTTNST